MFLAVLKYWQHLCTQSVKVSGWILPAVKTVTVLGLAKTVASEEDDILIDVGKGEGKSSELESESDDEGTVISSSTRCKSSEEGTEDNTGEVTAVSDVSQLGMGGVRMSTKLSSMGVLEVPVVRLHVVGGEMMWEEKRAVGSNSKV